MGKGLFKIYVGNLDYKVTEFSVRRLFEPYGDIEDIAMAMDKETGKPRGFAIVMMRDHDEAQVAITGVKGRKLMGRELVVNEAIKKKPSERKAEAEERSRQLSSGGSRSSERSGTSSSRPSSRGGGSSRGQYRARASSDGRDGGGSAGRNPRRGGGRNPRRGGSR